MSHGDKSTKITAPRSRFYQGPFGRIFPDLAPWSFDDLPVHALQSVLSEFADTMLETDNSESFIGTNQPDPADSSIPAGYTYFGQFVDHDITFDPASLLMRSNDPNGLINHRTPRLDLDSVYGGGPGNSPHLYDKNNTMKFLTDEIEGFEIISNGNTITAPDLPRNRQNIALLGDKRNDENAIIAQLHLAFLLAHNTLIDRLLGDSESSTPVKFQKSIFEKAQNTLRWLYQYIVWNDFLKRITDSTIHSIALSEERTLDRHFEWKKGLESIYDWKHQPFIPVEFSVAAYRFGHSMVRNSYQTNAKEIQDSTTGDSLNGFRIPVKLFVPGENGNDLRGGRALEPQRYIQWDWFLQMTSSVSDAGFPQKARKIDTKLSESLATLPEFSQQGSPENILAFRNLQRSAAFALPSGSDVARNLCYEVLPINDSPEDILWFYILNEAASTPGDNLGNVGSAIVCATFAGLLLGDPSSYFNIAPCWKPDDDELLLESDKVDGNVDMPWTLASIIRLAGLPVAAGDFV